MALKRIFATIMILFTMVGLSCVSKPSSYNKGVLDIKNARIAVIYFRDYNGNSGNNSGELIRNVFESVLLDRGYRVVEIEKAAASIDRDVLLKDACTSQWFIDTGKAMGADYIIYGSVHDYTVFQSYTTFIYIFGWLELTSSVGVTARMVSCSTGEVVWSGSLTRKSYSFNDAAEEAITELVKTIRHRSPKAQSDE